MILWEQRLYANPVWYWSRFFLATWFADELQGLWGNDSVVKSQYNHAADQSCSENNLQTYVMYLNHTK